jgi:hypothetical protein
MQQLIMLIHVLMIFVLTHAVFLFLSPVDSCIHPCIHLWMIFPQKKCFLDLPRCALAPASDRNFEAYQCSDTCTVVNDPIFPRAVDDEISRSIYCFLWVILILKHLLKWRFHHARPIFKRKNIYYHLLFFLVMLRLKHLEMDIFDGESTMHGPFSTGI